MHSVYKPFPAFPLLIHHLIFCSPERYSPANEYSCRRFTACLESGIYGDDAVHRDGALLSGGRKAWINTDDKLPAGILKDFYCFIHNSVITDRFRTMYLQIWKPIDAENLEFELLFSKETNIMIDSKDGLLLMVSFMVK